jgi:hypothetical protein
MATNGRNGRSCALLVCGFDNSKSARRECPTGKGGADEEPNGRAHDEDRRDRAPIALQVRVRGTDWIVVRRHQLARSKGCCDAARPVTASLLTGRHDDVAAVRLTVDLVDVAYRRSLYRSTGLITSGDDARRLNGGRYPRASLLDNGRRGRPADVLIDPLLTACCKVSRLR